MSRPPNQSETEVVLVDPLVGTIFDKRFRIEGRIAAGGFGAIYRAVHVKSGHEFALKILHATLASDLGVLARFRREGTTLTSLRHPHTITAYEFGQCDRQLFIVLELLHGKSLYDQYRAGGPMEWSRVARIAIQVCESLEEAHALGIVHRDLKPTNIHLEDRDGEPDFVKVLDFGIAKILRGSELDSDELTNAGQMIGTLDYMSPEQMVGGEVSGQTDIYTLGIVMYELIAGTRPFPESETAGAALAAMLKGAPTSLYLRAPVPQGLDAVVMRCLDRDTTKRYRTVGELKAELERLLADASTSMTMRVALDGNATFDTIDGDADEDVATRVGPRPGKLLDAQATRPRQRPAPEREDDSERRATEAFARDDDDLGDPVAPPAPLRPNPRPLPRQPEQRVPRVVVAPFSGGKVPTSSPRVSDSGVTLGDAPTLPALPPVSFPALDAQAPATVPPGATSSGADEGARLAIAPQPPAPAPAPLAPAALAPGPLGPGLARGQPTPAPGSLVFPPGHSPLGPPGTPAYPPPLEASAGTRGKTAAFDMDRIAARDAAVRRVVWGAVLLVAAGLGFVIATQL